MLQNLNLNFFLGSLFLSIIISLVISFSWLSIIIPALLILYYFFRNNFIIFLIIISYIALIPSELENVRIYITITATFFLIFLLIKKNGLDISNYPKLPGKVIILSFLLILIPLLSVINANGPKNFDAVIRLMVFLFICYSLYSLIDGSRMIYIYIITLFTAELIIGLSIYIDFLKGGLSFFLSNGILARFSGIYDNANFAGLTAQITFCLALVFLFSKKFAGKKIKFILYLFLLNIGGILLITDSRSAGMAVIVSSIFILFILDKKLLGKIIILVSALVTMLLFIPEVNEFIVILIRLEQFSAREYLWNSGWEVFKNDPLLGVGPQNFPYYFYTYMPSDALSLFKETGALSFGKVPSPHNFFFLWASENGIPGLIVSSLIFVFFFSFAVKNIFLTRNIDWEFYLLSLAFLGIGIGFLLRSFFEISGILYYGYISRDLFFWIIFIMVIYIHQKFSYPFKSNH